ncbi:MFS transporter [Actinacidiphila bryophytorum]|uniref:MFS transporter n=1 Tax=Actinacidiphila bryophytorum TaxID=1436133 RepID=A0A9W4GW49_9ACTN|nr:MFS transporter [Actinacidiphila bryophytorum]MBM9436386.1 MFS transporter [Actinacidiphila bryophytorum]MBN6545311.1 MFS transporter [Actinacidiphila bryophytorum]CAG7602184.1 MFS transporter [Actinacidiphila bryophytorum]
MSTPTLSAPVAEEGLFSPRYRGSSLAFAGVMFLVGFAALALVTTMPVAVRSLDGLGQYPLAFGSFVTAALFGSVLAGRLNDTYGPRRPLAAGLVLSVGALVVCGAAHSVWVLIAGRCLDGLAGSLVVVSVNVTVARTYPSGLRPRALSLMSVCWIVPSMAGPPVAGVVASATSWRWVFLGLAVLTAVVAAAAVVLARHRIADAENDSGEDGADTDWQRVGLSALLALGAGLLVYAGSGLHPAQVAAAVVGLVLLVPTAPRLLPPGALRAAAGLPTVVLLSGLCSGVYFTLESFVPLLLINHRHVPVSLAGTAFTGATIGWAGASWLQGHVWSAVPRHRLAAVGTAMTTTATVVAALGVPHAAPRLTAGLALVVAGAGMGLVAPSLTVLAFEYCRPEEQGRYSAALQVAQSLGQVLVMGLAGALYGAGTSGGRAGGAFAAVFALLFVLAAGTRLLAPRTTPARTAAH